MGAASMEHGAGKPMANSFRLAAFTRWFEKQGDRATPADLKSKIDDRRSRIDSHRTSETAEAPRDLQNLAGWFDNQDQFELPPWCSGGVASAEKH